MLGQHPKIGYNYYLGERKTGKRETREGIRKR
jgi:hypothetical protein